MHGEKELEKFYEKKFFVSYTEDPEKVLSKKLSIKLAKYLDEMRETCQFDLTQLKKFSIDYENLVEENALLAESFQKLDKILNEKEES